MKVYYSKESLILNSDDIKNLQVSIAEKFNCENDVVELIMEDVVNADDDNYVLILTHSKIPENITCKVLSIREDLMGAPLLYNERLDEDTASSIFAMITSSDTHTKDLGLAIALRYQMSAHADEQLVPAQIISPKLESVNHQTEYFKLYKILANSYFQDGIIDYLDQITESEPESSLRYKYCMWAVGLPY